MEAFLGILVMILTIWVLNKFANWVGRVCDRSPAARTAVTVVGAVAAASIVKDLLKSKDKD